MTEPTHGDGLEFDFGAAFQDSVIRLLLDDEPFRNEAMRHLEARYFSDPFLQWLYRLTERFAAEGKRVTPVVILEEARSGGPSVEARAERFVAAPPVRESGYIRDKLLDWIRRNLFVRAWKEGQSLYNAGDPTRAYDRVMEAMEKIRRTTFEPIDREFYFEELSNRMDARIKAALAEDDYTFPTGITPLDSVLKGGLSIGEVGAWVAYPKVGKTYALVDHAYICVRALRRPCLHVIYEGRRQDITAMFDARFADELRSVVERGEIDPSKYARMAAEFKALRGLLVVRSFSGQWSTTVMDLTSELEELRGMGFQPKLITADYWDLVRGRGRYDSERLSQRDAWRDLKTLADRGYGVWTASQAVRPKSGADEKEHLLRARDISESFDKVRVADFIGSINVTASERDARKARLFAELYRGNAAGKVIRVNTDYARGAFVNRELGQGDGQSVAAYSKKGEE